MGTNDLRFRRTLCCLATLLLWTAAAVSFAQHTETPPSEEQSNQAFTTARGFAEYRIGTGDELRIRIWTGVEAKEYVVIVQADGSIFLPFVGIASIQVSGLSALQLRDEIVDRLRVSYRQPAAEVVILERVARVVTLLGEIRSTQRVGTGPGRYALPGRIRLVDFITAHGGVSEQADINKTQLIRNGQSHVYNLSDAIFSSDVSQNPVLDDGDLVYVPSLSRSSRKFLVFGEVNRPGLLELPDELPVAEVIAHAGGFSTSAHKSHVVVVRGELEQPELFAANFEALKQGDLSQNFMLRDGDMIFVGRRKLATFHDVMRAFAEPLNVLVTTAVLANTLNK
jgi:polysaccharide export outer membrane protein